jgi:hypothetical protein
LKTNAPPPPVKDDLVTGLNELEAPSSPAQPSAFQTLLGRQVQPLSSTEPAFIKAEGIAIGTLVHAEADGSLIQVQIPSLGLGPLCAVSMVSLGPQHIGQSLALGFEGSNAHRPVVLGLMMQAHKTIEPSPPLPETDQHAVRITQNGRRVVVEAQTELELRCGEAVILLSEDGNIQIRGAYVTTHASASNRIRGGSVQIN